MSGELPFQRPMARRTDPGVSHEAATVVQPALGKIQQRVLRAYREHGPMTAIACEALPEFGDYGVTTVRKRVSELAFGGYLREAGVDRSARAPRTIYTIGEVRDG